MPPITPLRYADSDPPSVSTMADQRIVDKFHELDALEQGALPIATLAMLWYLDDDGKDAILWKFDGEIRLSITVGDLTALVHTLITQDET